MEMRYKIGELLGKSEVIFVKELYLHSEGKEFISFEKCPEKDKEKIKSWVDTLRFLKRYFSEVDKASIKNVDICFEYQIFDSTWIDAVILTKNKYIILEFKSGSDDREETLDSHRIQVNGYYNKITLCNKNIWEELNQNPEFAVQKYLIYTNPKMIGKTEALDYIKVTDEFRDVVAELNGPADKEQVDRWLNFDEKLDFTTVGVMKDILKRDLLHNMYVDTDNVSVCAKIIEEIAEDKTGQQLNLIFIKGAPGTGKTGTGLSLLEKYLDKGAKYVTGNGNLSKIFKEIVKKEEIDGVERAAIDSLHSMYDSSDFCKRYKDRNGNVQEPVISNDILIIDEAQRMWNPLQVALDKKANHPPDYVDYIIERGVSEAYIILHSIVVSIVREVKSKTVVFLMGAGQEIYVGEEDGEEGIVKAISQLCSTIEGTNIKVNVFVPDHNVADQFIGDRLHLEIVPELKLKENKRNQYSQDALQFVEALLDGNKERAKILARNLKDSFFVYNDFHKLKQSLDSLGSQFSYGMIMNSFDANFNSETKSSTFLINKEIIQGISNEGLYDYYINQTSNQMKTFVSQFSCQGLEMDYPALIWGDILKIEDSKWVLGEKEIYSIKSYCQRVNQIIKRNPTLSEKIPQIEEEVIRKTFIMNCYRVLLTRARIATLIYIEDKNTFEYISKII